MIATNIDAGAVSWEFADFVACSVPSGIDDVIGNLPERCWSCPAYIEDPAVAGGGRGSRKKRFCYIIHVGEVPQLLATPNLKWAALERAAQPLSEKSLAAVTNALTRSIAVGQPQGNHRPTPHTMLQHPILLARELGDAVCVWRSDSLIFIHRQVFHTAIELTG
jgi:hypothetical protein